MCLVGILVLVPSVCSYSLRLLLSLLRVSDLFIDIAFAKLGRGEGGAEESAGSGVSAAMAAGEGVYSSENSSSGWVA